MIRRAVSFEPNQREQECDLVKDLLDSGDGEEELEQIPEEQETTPFSEEKSEEKEEEEKS